MCGLIFNVPGMLKKDCPNVMKLSDEEVIINCLLRLFFLSLHILNPLYHSNLPIQTCCRHMLQWEFMTASAYIS
jgi:hypothetical protein